MLTQLKPLLQITTNDIPERIRKKLIPLHTLKLEKIRMIKHASLKPLYHLETRYLKFFLKHTIIDEVTKDWYMSQKITTIIET